MSDRSGEDARGLAALGEAIRALRSQAGLDEGELAGRAEIEPALLSQLEAGHREPTWGDLRRIAYALGRSLEELLELAEDLEGEEEG